MLTSCCSMPSWLSAAVLAAIDHPANGAFQEGMYGVIEQAEGDQCIFILILHFLGASWKPEH